MTSISFGALLSGVGTAFESAPEPADVSLQAIAAGVATQPQAAGRPAEPARNHVHPWLPMAAARANSLAFPMAAQRFQPAGQVGESTPEGTDG